MVESAAYAEHSAGERIAHYGRLVRAFYDEISPAYETVWGESFHFGACAGESTRAEAVAAAETLVIEAAGLRTGQRVLDIGCGIGGATRGVAARTAAVAVGMDISGVNVSRAKALTGSASGRPPLGFVQGDAMSLPFRAESFDAVYQFEVGCHLPDLDAWAAECRRVLVPGGRLVAWEWLAGERLDTRQRALNEDVCRGFSLAELRSLSQVVAALRVGGFAIRRVRDLSAEGLITDNWRQLAEEARYTDPRFGTSGRRLVAAARAGAFVIGMVVAERRVAPPRTVFAISVTGGGLVPSCRWRAVARVTSDEPTDPVGVDLVGSGAAASPALARTRAEMEALERHAQFAASVAPHEILARRVDLRGGLDPRSLGLYSSRQYASPGFPARPYDEGHAYRWVAVADARTGSEHFVPIEFVHPRAVSAPLVRETSSGTAAHESFEAAAVAALHELIERDALLRWWYRAQSARPLHPGTLREFGVQEDIDALNETGYVVLVVLLDAVAGACVHAAIALRGTASYVGSASATDPAASVRHALRELGRGVADWEQFDNARVVAPAVDQVSTGADHHRLYQEPRYAQVFRAFLATTVGATVTQPPSGGREGQLGDLVARLADCGCRPHLRALTADTSRGHVVRALIPELIPFHIGHNRERLGHRRLVSRHGANRLRTLLPHPFC